MCEEDDPDFMFLAQFVRASVLPMALRAVIEIGILEIIAKAGPEAHLSPAQIASQLPTQNPKAPDVIDRILRLMSSYSIITCSQTTHDNGHVERHYGLTNASRLLVQTENSVSLAPLFLVIQDKVFMESWYHVKDALLEGGVAFNRAHGMNLFEYQAKDPRLYNVFNSAMTNHSTIAMKRLLENYKGFEEVKEVVDVGGAIGTSLNMIISHYPHIKGINYDLPHVIARAPSFSGVEHVGGNMFESIPKGQTIFMKWILHDWSDEDCSKLLKNCYEALPRSGKIIAVESILPAFPDTSLAAKSVFPTDILMLVINEGGRERTEKDFEALGKGAGFASFKAVCRAFNCWVMEFQKND